MQDFLAYIIKNLVDYPDQVQIQELEGTHTIVFELRVAQPDIGKVIGKSGRTIKAIRSLLTSVASRNNIRVSLEIIEDEKQ